MRLSCGWNFERSRRDRFKFNFRWNSNDFVAGFKGPCLHEINTLYTPLIVSHVYSRRNSRYLNTDERISISSVFFVTERDFHLKSWKSDFETSKDATYKEIWIMLHYHLYVPLSRSFFMLENYTFIKSNILMSASFRLIRLLLLSKAESISLYSFKRFTLFNATRIFVSFFFSFHSYSLFSLVFDKGYHEIWSVLVHFYLWVSIKDCTVELRILGMTSD